MMPDRELPLLATGQLVEDYKPLFIYVDTAIELNKYEAKEAILLRGSDLNLVSRLVESGNLTLDKLLDTLTYYFRSRVDPEVATKALTKYLGYEVDVGYAIVYYSKLLASWAIEASLTLNMIKLKELHRL